MNYNQPTNRFQPAWLTAPSPPSLSATEVAAAPTRVSAMDAMSPSTHECLKQPLPEDRTTVGLMEGWIKAAVELSIAIGLVLFAVGAPLLLVAGTIYSTP
jgi:hypothetical protein